MKGKHKLIADALVKAYVNSTSIELSNGVMLAQNRISEALLEEDSSFDPKQFDDYIYDKFSLKIQNNE